MTLLEQSVELTLTGLPSWVEAVIAFLLGMFGGKPLVFGGVKLGVKAAKSVAPKAKDVAPSLLIATGLLALSGCACAVQREAIQASVNVLEPVIHDLEERAGATASERAANQKQIDTLKAAAK